MCFKSYLVKSVWYIFKDPTFFKNSYIVALKFFVPLYKWVKHYDFYIIYLFHLNQIYYFLCVSYSDADV